MKNTVHYKTKATPQHAYKIGPLSTHQRNAGSVPRLYASWYQKLLEIKQLKARTSEHNKYDSGQTIAPRGWDTRTMTKTHT